MSNNYNLRWNSADGQGLIFMGEFASKADTLAGISEAREELLVQCSTDEEARAGIEAGRFDVYYSGPEFIVENIELENNEGSLFASFDVRQINEGGDELYNRDTGDWIDLDDGLLISPDAHNSNMKCWPDDLSPRDLEEIHGIVNDYLCENPISEETLQAYRDRKEARKDADFEDASHSSYVA